MEIYYTWEYLRPPRHLSENNEQFHFLESTAIIWSFDKVNPNIIIAGDCNISLIKINDNEILGVSYILIFYCFSIPSSLLNSNDTLVDNLYCNWFYNKEHQLFSKQGVIGPSIILYLSKHRCKHRTTTEIYKNQNEFPKFKMKSHRHMSTTNVICCGVYLTDHCVNRYAIACQII